MSRFCVSCGFPLNASSVFCPQCGKAAAAADAPAAPPPSRTAPVSGSPILKVVLVVFVLLAVGAVAAVGLSIYAAHRVKNAVMAAAKNRGIDLPSMTSPGSSGSRKRYKPCALLSKDEASHVLGQPVERTVEDNEACLYYGPPGLSAKLAQQRATEVLDTAKNPDPKTRNSDPANMLNKMIGAASGVSVESGQEAPLLLLAVTSDAKPQWAALQASGAIFGGVPGMRTTVPNLGDQAMRLANLGLNVLQGGTMVRVVPGPVPGPEDKSVAIARIVLARL